MCKRFFYFYVRAKPGSVASTINCVVGCRSTTISVFISLLVFFFLYFHFLCKALYNFPFMFDLLLCFCHWPSEDLSISSVGYCSSHTQHRTHRAIGIYMIFFPIASPDRPHFRFDDVRVLFCWPQQEYALTWCSLCSHSHAAQVAGIVRSVNNSSAQTALYLPVPLISSSLA